MPAIRALVSRELIESRPKTWALPRAPADREGAADRPEFRVHAARAGRSARPASRRHRTVCEGRFRQSSDLFVQGSCGLGRRHPRRRAGLHGLRVRLDRQPGQQRGLARRTPGPRLLGLHSRQSRDRQGHGRGGLQAADHRRAWQLRRCEPAVHAGGGPYQWGFANINLRAYYAEGAKTVRLRDCRTARLALPPPRRLAGRRRHPAAADPEGIHRAPRGRVGRGHLPRSTRPRPPAARRWSARSRPASSIRNR